MTLEQKPQLNFDDFQIVEALSTVDDRRDLPWHSGRFDNESWFAVANLTSGDQMIGFLAHCLIMNLPKLGTVVSVKVSITEQISGYYRSFEFSRPINQIDIASDEFRIETPEFRFGGDRDEMTIEANLDSENAIDVRLKRRTPVMHVGGTGKFSLLGVDQYDFAIPAMETTGSVTLDGRTLDVSGPTWIDRQWGDLPDYFKNKAKGASMKWLWMDLQLSNDVNISLGLIVEFDSKTLSKYASIMFPDGSVALGKVKALEMYDYWTSGESGNSYPTRYYIEIPSIGAELNVQAAPVEQEIVADLKASTKYEGAADITGTCGGASVTGKTYIELVGHWR